MSCDRKCSGPLYPQIVAQERTESQVDRVYPGVPPSQEIGTYGEVEAASPATELPQNWAWWRWLECEGTSGLCGVVLLGRFEYSQQASSMTSYIFESSP